MEADIEVEKAEEPLPVRVISDHESMRQIARRMGRAIKNYIPLTAKPISSYKFAAEHLFYAILSSPLFLVAPILALTIHPIFLALVAIPITIFALPWLRLRGMIGDRKRAVDGELPFFTVHAAIAQSAGLNLYESLTSVIGKGVFKQIARDAEFLRRNVKVLGRSPIAALERLGRNHPHRGMQTLLLGYTSEYHAGGDLEGYLEGKASEYLRGTRRRWDRYVKDVGTVAEVILVVLFLFPILAISAIFLSPEWSFSIGLGFLTMGIPLILALCYSIIRSSQPKDYSKFHGNPYLPLVVAPVGIFILAGSMPLWALISIGIGVGLAAYGFSVWLQRRKALREEESLPQFLRDVTEYRKMDWPLKKTVETLWEESKYTSEFNELLGHAVKQVRMGRRFSEVELPTRSWLVKLGFFHLGQVAETGGFTTRSMELLTDFTTRVKEARDATRSSLGVYRWIAIAAPILLAIVVGAMTAMLTTFNLPQVMGGTLGGGGLPQLQTKVPPSFLFLSDGIITLSSIGMAFLTTYASDFTPKNTLWIALNAFLAGGAITLIPLLKEWIAGIFAIA